MTDLDTLEKFLAEATIAPNVFALRPDYRVLLLAVDGLAPGPSDDASDAFLQGGGDRASGGAGGPPAGGTAARGVLAGGVPGIRRQAAAHPQQPGGAAAPGGVRAARVNRLTDCYNAVSVLHQVPLGGEYLARYASSPRLIRAAGTEPFDTAAGGETVIEHPEPGEVVWCDSEGVTCRRWNWRQGRRTQLRENTVTALSCSTRSTR